jgi:hypothetical protein
MAAAFFERGRRRQSSYHQLRGKSLGELIDPRGNLFGSEENARAP